MKRINYSFLALTVLTHSLSIQHVRASAGTESDLSHSNAAQIRHVKRYLYNPCNDFLPTGRKALTTDRFLSFSDLVESKITAFECLHQNKIIQLESVEEAQEMHKEYKECLQVGIPVHIGGQWVTDNVLEYFQDAKALYLKYCDNVTGIGFKYLQNLDELALVRCTGIENEHFQYLKNIRSIDLTGTTSINNEALLNLKDVRVLNLARCSFITGFNKEEPYSLGRLKLDTPVYNFTGAIFSEFKNLEAINLSFCPQIKDHHLKFLAGVRYIDLSHSYGFSSNGLKNFGTAKWVNVESCYQISDQGIAYLNEAGYVNITRCDKVIQSPGNILKHLKVLDSSEWWENETGRMHLNSQRVFIG